MRVSVPLRRAYKLINHGPTTLLTSSANGRANVMAAAWVAPLGFDPARLTAVISGDTFTRELVERSGELVVNVPPLALKDAVYGAGQHNGRELDKFARLGLATEPASAVAPPLVGGCVAWLECRSVDEPEMRARHDLFIFDVVAAWADDRVWREGEWHFEAHPELRTLHHMSKGVFLTTGERIAVSEG